MLAGDVTAVEINEARARELEETARRLGAANVRVVVADGRALPAELDGLRPTHSWTRRAPASAS